MMELSLRLIPLGVLPLQAISFILLLCLIFARENALVKWVGRNALLISTLVVLIAVGGSEFYSLVAGFEPCLLCWWQRIFLFPQLILFIIATRKNDVGILKYTTPLSIIGGLVAIYQILLPYLEKYGVDCVTTGVSCTKLYVNAFGYITIPVMSLTVFVALILIAISYKLNKIYEK